MGGSKQCRTVVGARAHDADVSSVGAPSSSRSGNGPNGATRTKSISPELSSDMPTPTPPPKRARSKFESGLREIAALTGVAFSAFEQPPASDRRRRQATGRIAAVSPELASPQTQPAIERVEKSDATSLDRPRKKKGSGLASSYRREADALSRDCYSAAHDPKSTARGRTRSRTSFPEAPVDSVRPDPPTLETPVDRLQNDVRIADGTDPLTYAIVARASELERQEYRRIKRELKELEQPYFAASRSPVAGSSRSGKLRAAAPESAAAQDAAKSHEPATDVTDSLASEAAAAETVSTASSANPSAIDGYAQITLAADDATEISATALIATTSNSASGLRTAGNRPCKRSSSDSGGAETVSSARAKKQRSSELQSAEPSGTARDDVAALPAPTSRQAGHDSGPVSAPTANGDAAVLEDADKLASTSEGPPSSFRASDPRTFSEPQPLASASELGISDPAISVSGLSKRQRRPPTRFDDEVDAAEAARKRSHPGHQEQTSTAARSRKYTLKEQQATLKMIKIQKLPGAKKREKRRSTTTLASPPAAVTPPAGLSVVPPSVDGTTVADAAIEADSSAGWSRAEVVPSTTKGRAFSPMTYEQLTIHLPPESHPGTIRRSGSSGADALAAPGPSPKKRSVAKQAVSSAATGPKQPKPRARHPALDSTETWVVPERDMTMTREGRPPIWCEGRQELCESLNYFKSYQGGHYDSQERCLGYLLEGFGTPNDVCAENGKIVISHGGGCSEVVTTPGANANKGEAAQRIFRLKASQTRDNLRMRALVNCQETKTPVVLIAGTQWPFFPALKSLGKKHEGDATARYAVLGHYLVTDIWAEGETIDHAATPGAKASSEPDFFVRFKVRFEWVPSQGKPWFDQVIGGVPALDPPSLLHEQPEDAPMSDALSDVASLDSGFLDSTTPPPTPSKTSDDIARLVHCAECEQEHAPIYEEAINCYNEECPQFFLLDGVMPRPASLTYRRSLLRTTSLPTDSLVPERLMPKTLQELAGTTCITDYSERAWRGYGCSLCGRLSSRSDWLRLRCSGCGTETDATGRLSLPSDWRRVRQPGEGPNRLDSEAKPASVLADYRVEQIRHVPGYTGYSVELLDGVDPDSGVGRAKVHHLWPCTEATFRDADELFNAYQGPEAGKLFKRNRLTRHAAVGALLCQQFTQNAGVHYKHVIGAETYPFRTPESTPSSDDGAVYAPSCAQAGRDHLAEIVNSLKGDRYRDYTQFNEVLSVAYMTGGRMNYHDDGERGLGPFVASISLGADAIMSFRAKGAKQKRPTGAAIPNKRKSSSTPSPLQAEDEEVQLSDEDKAGGRPPAGDPKRASNKSRVVLKLRLKHGDVMLMEGEDMQRKFEHKVEPEGLRFAATARFIGPDHFRPASKVATKPSGPSKARREPQAGMSRFAYQDRPDPTKRDVPAEVIHSLEGIQLPDLPSKSTPTAGSTGQADEQASQAPVKETQTSTLQVMLNSEHRRASPFSSADFADGSPTTPFFSEAPEATTEHDLALEPEHAPAVRAVSPALVFAQAAEMPVPGDNSSCESSSATKRPLPPVSQVPSSPPKRPRMSSGQGAIVARAIQSAVNQAAPPPRPASLPLSYRHREYPSDALPRPRGSLYVTPEQLGQLAFSASGRTDRYLGPVHRPWVPTPIAPQDPSIPHPIMYEPSTNRAQWDRAAAMANGFVVKGAAGFAGTRT